MSKIPEFKVNTPLTEEQYAALILICEELELDLSDPNNVQWLQERLMNGFSETTIKLAQSGSPNQELPDSQL